MAYWLLKSEPDEWSWAQQVAEGRDGAEWTGIRNFSARNHLRAMKKGEQVFFYHSNEGLEIVGIVEVIREAYPDPTVAPGEPWVVVDLKAVKPMPRPVTLAEVKATPALARMSLVTSMRLSVQPVTDDEWALICRMGGL